MHCSIRCWKLSRVSILCLTRLAEAQSFGLLAVYPCGGQQLPLFFLPPDPWELKGMLPSMTMLKFAWMHRSQWISLTSIKGFLLKKPNIKILSLGVLSKTRGTFFWDVLQPCLFLFKASRASMKAQNTGIHHCSAFAFLFLINYHIWFPCSGGFLNTYFSCPQRAAPLLLTQSYASLF